MKLKFLFNLLILLKGGSGFALFNDNYKFMPQSRGLELENKVVLDAGFITRDISHNSASIDVHVYYKYAEELFLKEKVEIKLTANVGFLNDSTVYCNYAGIPLSIHDIISVDKSDFFLSSQINQNVRYRSYLILKDY